ncbi:hypothetical protein ASC83_03535 [Acidovorax sp. Root402]|nr:hypothetical protein ASC83_03535 [Acidovorax sp. Root402]
MEGILVAYQHHVGVENAHKRLSDCGQSPIVIGAEPEGYLIDYTQQFKWPASCRRNGLRLWQVLRQHHAGYGGCRNPGQLQQQSMDHVAMSVTDHRDHQTRLKQRLND